jgi:hypothetical protein
VDKPTHYFWKDSISARYAFYKKDLSSHIRIDIHFAFGYHLFTIHPFQKPEVGKRRTIVRKIGTKH